MDDNRPVCEQDRPADGTLPAAACACGVSDLKLGTAHALASALVELTKLRHLNLPSTVGRPAGAIV